MPQESPATVASRIVTMFTDPTERTQMAGAIEDAIRSAVAEATAPLQAEVTEMREEHDIWEKHGLVQIVKDRDSLKAKLAAEREAVQALSAFWTRFVEGARDSGFWGAGDMDSEDLWQTALAAGLVELVKYDPEIHGEIDDAEPGDEIWYVTELGQRLSSAPIREGTPQKRP